MARDLFGQEGGGFGNGEFYLIDITQISGGDTLVGTNGRAISGMAFDPTDSTLYATTGGADADPRQWATIDRLTGVVTLIGPTGLAKPLTDIAINSAGEAYGMTAGANPQLASIDKQTGVATLIGSALPNPAFGGACEFVDDVLYWIPSSNGQSIRSIDLATGAPTVVSTLSAFANANCASYNPDEATLYVGATSNVGTLDLASGAGTFVKTPDPSLDALAWFRSPSDLLDTVIRLSDPPLWRLLLCQLDPAGTGTFAETPLLTILDHRATDRSFLFELNTPATATGLVPADDPEINIPYPSDTDEPYMSHNTRFLFGLRREMGADPPYVCRFAGIVMQLDDVAGDAPTCRYTAFDPWQLLFSRPCRNNDGSLAGEAGIVYEDARCSDIAIDFIENTLTADGPIFLDTDSGTLENTAVILGTQVFEQGLSVGQALQRLCDTGTMDIVITPVYDPIDRPGIIGELNIYNRAGELRADTVFGWDKPGNSIIEISRLVDGTQLANRVHFYAGQAGQRGTLNSDTDSITTYGEYWLEQFSPDAKTLRVIADALGEAAVQELRNGQRTIAFDPAPERSDLVLRDYHLGDYVAVWASRNLRDPIEVDYNNFDPDFPGAVGYQRVYAIPIDLDDNGVERVRSIRTSQDTAVGG